MYAYRENLAHKENLAGNVKMDQQDILEIQDHMDQLETL